MVSRAARAEESSTRIHASGLCWVVLAAADGNVMCNLGRSHAQVCQPDADRGGARRRGLQSQEVGLKEGREWAQHGERKLHVQSRSQGAERDWHRLQIGNML